MLHDPHLASVYSIGIPWFTVRKVPVEITTPSPRVAVIKFKKGIQQGLLGRISRSSIMEYHGFGIISEGIESNAHYIIAGVQGDWTRGLVADPPKYLYTREMKVRSDSRYLIVPIADNLSHSLLVFPISPTSLSVVLRSAQAPVSALCCLQLCSSTTGS